MRIAVALALAACSSRDHRAATSAGSGSGVAHARSDAAVSTLAVDTPGKEPRRIVAYSTGKVERTAEFVLTNDGPWPIAELKLTWTCAPPAPCTYQLLRFAAAGDDKMFAGITKEVHGDVKVASDGTAEIAKANVFANLTPSPEELIDMAIVKFPTTPIGIGARWHVDDGDKHTVFALTELTDTTATVGLSFEQTADQGRLTGEGELAVSFADPLARGRFDEHMLLVIDPSVAPPTRLESQLEIR